ncbi:hypothetical protein [Lactiplantibacillus paraplantarum]|nr:hypothetical protein [Lactiplantibacillus paraplantarum]
MENEHHAIRMLELAYTIRGLLGTDEVLISVRIILAISLSQKYKTKDFLKKTAVPFVTLILINFIAELILGRGLVLIINFAGNIWYGFMFDTWFKNQLVVNGYHVDNSAQSESDTGQNDFE